MSGSQPSASDESDETPRSFSLGSGPFVRACERLHLTRRDATPRVWAFVAITWCPLAITALVRLAAGQRPEPILYDLSVHARLLVMIPLLVISERVLEQRCRVAITQLYDGRFTDRAALDRILDRAERMRESRAVELALAAAVILYGQATLWGLANTGPLRGISEAGGASFAYFWYVAISLPVAKLLGLRWLWHWAIWSYILVRVSRLPLATIATHPDRAAGIGFVALPVSAFVGFVLALAATAAAAWGTQILRGTATVTSFGPVLATFLVASWLLAFGPLLCFTGALYRARQREVAHYHPLALECVRQFHRKWIEQRSPTPLLDTADTSVMNDLFGTYDGLSKVRLVVFGPRLMAEIAAAALLPMLPLIATTVPLPELLGRLGHVLLGGLPV